VRHSTSLLLLVTVWTLAVHASIAGAETAPGAMTPVAAQTSPQGSKPSTNQQKPASTESTTVVSVATATLHARCDESSPVRTILARGESVQIQGFQETWVHVRVPSTGEEGCMRRSQLERVPAMDRADEARRAQQTAAAPGASPSTLSSTIGSAIISLNWSYQSASDTFTDQNTFDVDLETARYTSTYDVETDSGFDLGALVPIWKQLGVGIAATRFTDSRDITIEGTIPHRFFFNRDRPFSGTAPGEREEIGVHLDAVYFIPIAPKLQLAVFGGATFFRVKQSVVTDIDYTESYPFDEVTFTGATVTTEDESKVGFNVGADFAYYFTDIVGVGGIVRYSQAKVPFSIGDLDVGGPSFGAGVRIRIP
jgi:hypothetical protein